MISGFDLLAVADDPTTDRNKVCHYMTGEVVTIDVETPIREVARAFRERSIRRFLVVSNGQVIGIISRREVIRHIRETRIAHSVKCSEASLAEA